jgi:hypothetical protein
MNNSTGKPYCSAMNLVIIVVLATLLLPACGDKKVPLTVPTGAQAALLGLPLISVNLVEGD